MARLILDAVFSRSFFSKQLLGYFDVFKLKFMTV